MKWLTRLFKRRPKCDHRWEACAGGTPEATMFVCSRCDTGIVAPVKQR
jgi:hypothetical protein